MSAMVSFCTASTCHCWLCRMVCVLQPLIQPGVQLVVANFPHNPTGTMLAKQDWQQLVSACEAAGAWLFSDEMYKFSGTGYPVTQLSVLQWY